MKDAKHIYIAAGIVVLVLIAGSAFIASKVNVARADQVKHDVAPVHQDAAQVRQEARHDEGINKADLAMIVGALNAQKQQPVAAVDYDRIAQMIEARMGAKAIIKADPEHPDAPSATLPARQLRDFILDSDACKAELGSCQKSVVNVTREKDAEVKDHAATKMELAAARKAMKGGSFFQRFKSNGKWFVIGGVAGAITVAATRR